MHLGACTCAPATLRLPCAPRSSQGCSPSAPSWLPEAKAARVVRMATAPSGGFNCCCVTFASRPTCRPGAQLCSSRWHPGKS